jgi:cytosine/adenosine deaminase-related metal-dependent hydrolase
MPPRFRSSNLLLPLLAAAVLSLAALHAPAAERADIVITNARVLTMNAQREVISPGAVVMRGERIVAVGPASITKGFKAKRTIDAAGDIVMPGMINLHTHTAMTVFRGLGDDVADRLRRYMQPLERGTMNAEMAYWGASHGFIEMVEGGVTTVVDMYPYPESTARTASEVNIRAVVTHEVADDPAPVRKFIEEWRKSRTVIPALALHAPYSTTPDQVRLAAKLSKELDVLVSMHVAEMDYELAELKEKYNQTPIEYLDSLGILGPKFIAAHCIFLTDSDIALLKARGAGVSHNMVANIKSAKGVAPVIKLRAAGVNVGLGTDGPMSGNTLDIITQLGYVAKVQKLANLDRTLLPAIDVVDMATMGGARVLGMADRLGSLEAGKLADVVIVDTHSTNMVPLYDPYSALVYSAGPRDVRTTIVNGRELMTDRKLRTVDAAKVAARVRTYMAQIQKVADTLD